MHKNTIKNLTIFILVALTVFQTAKLWFGDSSNNSSSFSFFQKEISTSQSESAAKLASPYRIITNISENDENTKLAIIYNNLTASELKKAGDNAIEQVLKKGEYVGSLLYSPSITDRLCIEYEYAFSMPSDIFVQHFKQKSNILTGRVKQFDAITIIPNDGEDNLTVLFADKTSNNCYEYKVSDSDANKELWAAIDAVKASHSQLYYKLSVIGESAYIFPAFWDGSAYKYNNVTAFNPYGELTLANIEKYVDPFFDNPAAKQFQNKNDVYTFSDEKTVVYYYPNDVLECSVHQYFSSDVASSFISAFSVAMDLLAKDTTLDNDFYLSGYTQEQNGFVFKFNYCINDFPLYFSNDLRTKTEMDNMIEISVAKDSAKYRRYISSYEINDMISYAGNDFYSTLYALGVDAESAELNGEEINLFDLGYKIDGSDILYLNWFIDINGVTFVQPAE